MTKLMPAKICKLKEAGKYGDDNGLMLRLSVERKYDRSSLSHALFCLRMANQMRRYRFIASVVLGCIAQGDTQKLERTKKVDAFLYWEHNYASGWQATTPTKLKIFRPMILGPDAAFIGLTFTDAPRKMRMVVILPFFPSLYDRV